MIYDIIFPSSEIVNRYDVAQIIVIPLLLTLAAVMPDINRWEEETFRSGKTRIWDILKSNFILILLRK